jgi:hypothetical protein
MRAEGAESDMGELLGGGPRGGGHKTSGYEGVVPWESRCSEIEQYAKSLAGGGHRWAGRMPRPPALLTAATNAGPTT